MESLININTNGLAKLGEVISFALGGTARGKRKMAEAKAYAAELEARTKNKVALIEAQGQEALANYVAAKESRKLRNTMAVIEKAQSHFTEGEKVSDEPVDEGWKNRFFWGAMGSGTFAPAICACFTGVFQFVTHCVTN